MVVRRQPSASSVAVSSLAIICVLGSDAINRSVTVYINQNVSLTAQCNVSVTEIPTHGMIPEKLVVKPMAYSWR